ncbi:hypothetical protein BASA83_008547 [Batrachochytrium salamandrivorans]|nr:hypothetical protein BASA83_008547 [Batrachochytrium salamandrivorans]
MHYYLTGTAFSRIEEENLLSAFRICRPDIVLPDRKKGWAVHCLTVVMPRSKSVVDNHIEEMKLNACLTSDAWSNIKNEPIVNYMLISDSSTFFLESVSTGEQSHVAKWIAQDMGRMIDSLAGKMKAQLQKAQLAENLSGLVQSVPTRRGSLKACFESLRKSEHVLHRTVSTRNFIQGTGEQKESQQKIHDIITDDWILIWRCNWVTYLLDPRFVGKKMTAFKRTKVEDLIFDYGSETEQSQQMGKKEEMYLQYTNFVIKANYNKDQKDVSLPDVGKGNQDYPAVLVGRRY